MTPRAGSFSIGVVEAVIGSYTDFRFQRGHGVRVTWRFILLWVWVWALGFWGSWALTSRVSSSRASLLITLLSALPNPTSKYL